MKSKLFIAFIAILAIFIANPIQSQVIVKGKAHQLVLGHGKGPLKVKYFNNGDTIHENEKVYTVVNAYKLNKIWAYYEQGYKNYSERQLRRKFSKYCTIK